MLPAGGDGVVEVCVGLLPRLVDAPGRVRLAEEEALRADPPVRPDASPPVGRLRRVCKICAISHHFNEQRMQEQSNLSETFLCI